MKRYVNSKTGLVVWREAGRATPFLAFEVEKGGRRVRVRRGRDPGGAPGGSGGARGG